MKGKGKYCRISRNAFLKLRKDTSLHSKRVYWAPSAVNEKTASPKHSLVNDQKTKSKVTKSHRERQGGEKSQLASDLRSTTLSARK